MEEIGKRGSEDANLLVFDSLNNKKITDVSSLKTETESEMTNLEAAGLRLTETPIITEGFPEDLEIRILVNDPSMSFSSFSFRITIVCCKT